MILDIGHEDMNLSDRAVIAVRSMCISFILKQSLSRYMYSEVMDGSGCIKA